jgi:hypothetical protein
VLVNLDTKHEQELQAGEDYDNWYVLSNNEDGQYSIRCDNSSPVSTVSFAFEYYHDVHTERKVPYWMNGDYNNHYGHHIVTDVPYLRSCGVKTVAIWATDDSSSSHYDDNDNHECFGQVRRPISSRASRRTTAVFFPDAHHQVHQRRHFKSFCLSVRRSSLRHNCPYCFHHSR